MQHSEDVVMVPLHKRQVHCAIFCLVILFVLSCPNILKAETVYFLVGGFYSTQDSYVLPLSDSLDIAHARDLIENGIGIGGPLVVATIDHWDPNDGINNNRDYYQAGMPAWSWYVTSFEGFADFTIEILDGDPTAVEDHLEWWIQNTGGFIGFWGYTVVAELGTDLKPWNCDLSVDGIVDGDDLGRLASQWLNTGCEHRYYCEGTDIDGSGEVNFTDFAVFANNWLWQE